MTIDEFRIKHSDLIRFFQIIEGDLKCIFAIMKNGGLNENYEIVKNMTLGQIVNNLKKLDKSDNNQYISDSDYNFLKQMADKRNYWCHVCYRDFLYVDNWECSNEYRNVCCKLENDWNRLSIAYKNVEQAKIKANDYYRK